MNYEHHLFCNYWNKPFDEEGNCKYCKVAFEKYPIDAEKDISEQILEYFPDVIIRK